MTSTPKPVGLNPNSGEYTDDENELIRAVDRWRKKHKRKFPTAVDILRIAVSLGWRRDTPAPAAQEV